MYSRKRKNNQLPFLDIWNDILSNKLVTSVYRKPTYTKLLTNYNSFTSPNYKKDLIETLIDPKFRINNNIELVFSSFKISSLFLMKDRVPFDLRSYVVYNFDCGSSKADYIGRTKRHLSTRIKEHLETDKKSHVYKQLNELQGYKSLSNKDCSLFWIMQWRSNL